MRKFSIRSKLLEWKALTMELTAHLETDEQRLPKLVQTILEVASETDTPTRSPKKTDDKQSSSRIPFVEEVAAALGTSEMTAPEILASLRKTSGYNPQGASPQLYISTLLAQKTDMFERVRRGVYRNKQGGPILPKTVLKLVPLPAPEPNTANVAEGLASFLKVVKFLASGPASLDEAFSPATVKEKTGLGRSTVHMVLEQLRTQKLIAKKSGYRWRVRDRAALVAKFEECRKQFKTSQANVA